MRFIDDTFGIHLNSKRSFETDVGRFGLGREWRVTDEEGVLVGYIVRFKGPEIDGQPWVWYIADADFRSQIPCRDHQDGIQMLKLKMHAERYGTP